MSQQVYNNETAAVGKPFIDQRVSALEVALIKPVTANRLAYFTGATSDTINSSPFTVAGNNIILPDGSNIGVDSLTAIAPLPGQNYINIAGVNVGIDAPVGGLSIIAPVAATNANVLLLAGSNLNVQFADATFPGVVSAVAQTFAGAKTFPSGIFVDVIKATSPTALNIGGDATSLNLTPTSGNMTIDQLTLGSGSIFIGNTSASTVMIGRVGTTTTITGTADISTLDRGSTINIGTSLATAINISKPGITTTINGIADIVLQDRAGAISIGPSLATSLAIGRAAITTTLNGTIDAQTIDRAGPISIGATNVTALNLGRATVTTTINGTANIAVVDRAGTITVGTTNATAITLGRAGVTTMIDGTADIRAMDRAGTIGIGTASATGITVGRVGITTTVNGTLGVGGGTITTFGTSSLTSDAGGAIPATVGYMFFDMRVVNTQVNLTWRILVGNVVATSAGAITMTSALPAGYRPPSTISQSAIVNINGNLYPGYLTITAAGAMSFNIQGGVNGGVIDFQIGQSCSARSGSCSFSTV